MRGNESSHSSQRAIMKRPKTIIVFLVILLLAATTTLAQDKSTGSIKGKIRVKGQGPASDVTVTVRQKDTEVAHTVTNSKGEFQIKGLAPGSSGLTFCKKGLSVGSLEDVQVKEGMTHELPDRLILTINEATIARLSDSVFSESGCS